jgi:hypothetical protein
MVTPTSLTTSIVERQTGHIAWGVAVSTAVNDLTAEASAAPMLASTNGVVGNGVADDSAALNALLATAATAGREVVLAPKSTVRCVSAITPPTGTQLNLNGATLKNASTSTTGRVLDILSVSDVAVYNGTIDGDKASFATTTEQRHNINVRNSSRILFRDIRSINAKGDGMYVGDNLIGFCSDVTLINVWGEYNHRNGLSISAVKGFRQFGGGWRYTSGTSPKSGCDIEPNNNTTPVESIQFFGVAFDFNDWNGFVGHTAYDAAPTAGAHPGVTLVSCTANGNGINPDLAGEQGHGFSFRWAADYSLVRCEANGNAYAGVRFRSTNTNLSFDVDVCDNGYEGVRQVEGTTTDLKITGRMLNNGTSGTYDGINLAAAGSRAIIDVVSSGNTRYGIRSVAGWSQVTYGSGCRFPSNTTGTINLSDDYGTRIQLLQESGWRYGGTASTDTALATRTTSDTVNRFGMRVDGRLSWSTGTSAIDVTLERTAAGTIAVGAGHAIRTGRAATGSRPAAATVGSGAMFFDTTLGKPIWSTGSAWVDATGATV